MGFSLKDKIFEDVVEDAFSVCKVSWNFPTSAVFGTLAIESVAAVSDGSARLTNFWTRIVFGRSFHAATVAIQAWHSEAITAVWVYLAGISIVTAWVKLWRARGCGIVASVITHTGHPAAAVRTDYTRITQVLAGYGTGGQCHCDKSCFHFYYYTDLISE